ncbi:MAG: S-ribosylhomocysteine lyase, partial [Campylobacteraceae bacterium]|nr:S-ribosylhomocysteine lyase [Campylobacteraceae bacterium]
LRRSLPITDAIECERVLTKAVDIATKYKKLLSTMLIERDLVRVDDEKLNTYLNLYANDSSISMSEIQLKAVNRLFEIGYKNGFYPSKVDAFASLVPTEYQDFRNC